MDIKFLQFKHKDLKDKMFFKEEIEVTLNTID